MKNIIKYFLRILSYKLNTIYFFLNLFISCKFLELKPLPLCDIYHKYELPIPAFVGHVVAPTVFTTGLFSKTGTTITYQSSINDTGNENASERGHCYKLASLSGDPTTSDSKSFETGSFGTGSFTNVLTGLLPTTTYKIRPYAINSAGTGYGATDTATTDANAQFSQSSFRFYEDGTESGSSPIANQDTNINRDVISGNSNLLARLRLQETFGGLNFNTDDFQLYASKNGGSYKKVLGERIDKYEFTNYDTTVAFDGTSITGVAQSFKGDGRVLQSIDVYLSKTGSPVNIINCAIYTHSGTFGTSSIPVSVLYASGNYSSSSLTTSLQKITFNASGADILEKNVSYCLVITYNSEGANTVNFAIDNSSPTHQGNRSVRNSSFVWSAVSGDLIFNINPIEGSAGEGDNKYIANGNSSNGLDGTSNWSRGQTFKSKGGVIDRVKFKVQRNATAIGFVNARIYAHTGTFGVDGVPTGSPLAISDNFFASLLPTSADYVTFWFSGANKITLQKDTNYVVVFWVESAQTENINFYLEATSPTHEGNLVLGQTPSTWSANGSADAVFELFYSDSITGFNSSNLTEGNPTTNRLGAGSGSFTAGKVSKDAEVDDFGIGSASNYTEFLYSLKLLSASLVDADTIDLRVYRNNVALNGYGITPRITAQKNAGGSVNSGFFGLM